MPTTTLSSRELNQDIGRAKKAARSGPVVITDRGNPAFVLTTFEDHLRAENQQGLTLIDALAMPEDDVEIQLPFGAFYQREVDFD